MNRRFALNLILVSLLALSTAACAGRAWNSALKEDSAAGYARFMREHTGSEYAGEAKARLAFVRVRSKPTQRAFNSFQKRFPGSPLVDELRPYMETVYFDHARAVGSVASYEEFLGEFPSGQNADRALGNVAYLQAGGFANKPEAIGAFVKEHPKSDYAVEAKRSMGAVEERGKSGFRRVGLILDVPAAVPSADRLRRLFAERAIKIYRAAGVTLVPLSGTKDPRASEVGAWLYVSHREHDAEARYDGAAAESVPSALAETTVSLRMQGAKDPIWEDTISFRIPVNHRSPGESALLHPRAWNEFWEGSFFVPVATWDTRAARREASSLSKAAAGIEVQGGRAIVLFGDGGFRLLDLSDPNEPRTLGDYSRQSDLSHFEGVKALPSGIAVYGPDGLEIVQQTPKGPKRGQVFGRDDVGSVVGVEVVRGGMVAAGSHGLRWLGKDGSRHVLFPRPVLGLARRGSQLVFTDGVSLFVSSVATLRAGRVDAELRLGRGFHPGAIHLNGDDAVVLGGPGLVWVDLRNPTKPRVVSRIDRSEVGSVRDAVVVGGRVYLLGDRGLQVSDASGERIVGAVDVAARDRIGVSGRHVVLIGDQQVQVVDTTAFTGVPASR